MFPAPGGGVVNLDPAGIRTPARIYDTRSTFASDALATEVPVLPLARIMGASSA